MRTGQLALFLTVAILPSFALYDSSDDVYELTASNFDSMVINSHYVWVVEFYAPWCGHCQALAPEYKKAAKALNGIVRVGAVNADEHQQLGGRYGVKGFPIIKIFGANKNKPTDYQGQRTADAIVEESFRVARDVARERMGAKKSSGGGSGGSSGGGSGGGVIELTDDNFDQLVLQSEDLWLVEFYAPWCGHCKNLAPHWAAAATELKGKVKLGAVDATVHKAVASRYQIQGFPTIKSWPAGSKTAESFEDYSGGRTTSDIVQWALERWSAKLPPPEILQLTGQAVLEECAKKQLCVLSFLPHILDSGAEGRNGYIETLLTLGEKYKQRSFGWVWAEGGQFPDLEEKLGIGGFGYPAMATVNSRRKVFSILRGAFSDEGLSEFVRNLIGQRGVTIAFDELPTIPDVEPWDGKDGELPVEDDWDLSDFDMDEDVDTKDEL
jgi:protein disulfide-isomerase A6